MKQVEKFILKKLIIIEKYKIGKIYLSKDYEYIKNKIIYYLIDKKNK